MQANECLTRHACQQQLADVHDCLQANARKAQAVGLAEHLQRPSKVFQDITWRQTQPDMVHKSLDVLQLAAQFVRFLFPGTCFLPPGIVKLSHRTDAKMRNRRGQTSLEH